jgi:hypothetical protein
LGREAIKKVQTNSLLRGELRILDEEREQKVIGGPQISIVETLGE